MMMFASLLRDARKAAGLTQLELAERSGVARSNIAAYESARREPLFHSAIALLQATSAEIVIEAPVAWSWTSDPRPYAVPSRLWRLEPLQALRTLDPGRHLWWSGPPRTFDLSQRDERLRAYEIVLREGTPNDIESVIDAVLLVEAWSDLVIPRSLRTAWSQLIDPDAGVRSLPAASLEVSHRTNVK